MGKGRKKRGNVVYRDKKKRNYLLPILRADAALGWQLIIIRSGFSFDLVFPHNIN